MGCGMGSIYPAEAFVRGLCGGVVPTARTGVSLKNRTLTAPHCNVIFLLNFEG